MQHYVLGFLFSESGYLVALIRKNKPEWQKGKLNGIGGKIEEGETPYDAMCREFEEETGVRITSWDRCAEMSSPTWKCVVFCAFSQHIDKVRSTTDEEVIVTRVDQVIRSDDIIPNLGFLIPYAQRYTGEKLIIKYPN